MHQASTFTLGAGQPRTVWECAGLEVHAVILDGNETAPAYAPVRSDWWLGTIERARLKASSEQSGAGRQ